jgi:hypothetical protein
MKDALQTCAYPTTEAQFRRLLEETYTRLTGVPLTNQEPIFIERYDHGGMSGGYVSAPFWTEKALPMLLARYRALK